MKKIYDKRKKIKRSQTNYIKNYHSLVNIEQLNAGEAFWFGLAAGFVAFWLMNDKSEEKVSD